MANCRQACPYNTLDGCKVKEYNAICPLTNMATPITEYRMTNADRIRAMSDEKLKYIARAVIESLDCPMGETECTDCVFHDLCVRGEYYYNNEEEWLKQPAEDTP